MEAPGLLRRFVEALIVEDEALARPLGAGGGRSGAAVTDA
jgi:hypothetical protein